MTTSRRHAPHLDVIVHARDHRWELASPGVGWFRPSTSPGDLLAPGGELGTLEVLGRSYRLLAPRVRGVVVAPGEAGGRAGLIGRGVAYGELLAVIDPSLGTGTAAGDDPAAVAAAGGTADGLVFTAPTSGRFYGRPGPGKAAFVAVGDVIGEGHTICLLEVMKTFNRVTYGGPGLPPRAKVTAVLVADESDVDAGAPLVRLDPVD